MLTSYLALNESDFIEKYIIMKSKNIIEENLYISQDFLYSKVLKVLDKYLQDYYFNDEGIIVKGNKDTIINLDKELYNSYYNNIKFIICQVSKAIRYMNKYKTNIQIDISNKISKEVFFDELDSIGKVIVMISITILPKNEIDPCIITVKRKNCDDKGWIVSIIVQPENEDKISKIFKLIM